MKLKISLIKVIIPILIILCVVATAILIGTSKRRYQAVKHMGIDMEPTISKNETVFITKEIENIKRGDIVVFKYPADQKQSFIKRVVGLPGEVVSIREGRVYIDQKQLEENYLDSKRNTSTRTLSDRTIPPRTYYVLGDNRDNSNDSRFWGPLSVDLIYGRVMFK
jgi:signal peptidase I